MGLFSSLLRGLVVRRPGSSGAGGAAGGAPGVLAERIRAAEEALQSVMIPGYDVDIVSGGLVERIRVSYDGYSVMVVLGYKKSDPGCSTCRFISSVAWAKIVEAAREALRAQGFQRILLVDADTGAVLGDYREGGG
ncbi:hypothetical protein [Pyrodictium occultum]|uniref:hypothetical protein n=1 Tax=Pyrodictium occultum TaxID=2309 RepID=UPI00071E98EC|nr:hypothetical protein [Pyrodictium occultum]